MNLDFGATAFENVVYIRMNSSHTYSLKNFAELLLTITGGRVRIVKPYKITNAIKIFDQQNPLHLSNEKQRIILAKTIRKFQIDRHRFTKNLNIDDVSDVLKKFIRINNVTRIPTGFVDSIVEILHPMTSTPVRPPTPTRLSIRSEDVDEIHPLTRHSTSSLSRQSSVSLSRRPSVNIALPPQPPPTPQEIDDVFEYYYNLHQKRMETLGKPISQKVYNNNNTSSNVSVSMYLQDTNNNETFIRFEESIVNYTKGLLEQYFGATSNISIRLNQNDDNDIKKIIGEKDMKQICDIGYTYLTDHGYNIFIYVKSNNKPASMIAVNFEKRAHFYFYYDDLASEFKKFKDVVYESSDFNLFDQITSYISVVCNSPSAPRGTGSKLIELIKKISYKLNLDTVTLDSVITCQTEVDKKTKLCKEYLHEFYLKRDFVFDIDELFIDTDSVESETGENRLTLLLRQLSKNSTLGTKEMNKQKIYDTPTKSFEEILHDLSNHVEFYNTFIYEKIGKRMNRVETNTKYNTVVQKIKNQIKKMNLEDEKILKKQFAAQSKNKKNKNSRRSTRNSGFQKFYNKHKNVTFELLVPMIYFLDKEPPTFTRFGKFYKNYMKRKHKKTTTVASARRKYELALLGALHRHFINNSTTHVP